MSVDTRNSKLLRFRLLPTSNFRFLRDIRIEKKFDWDGSASCEVELFLNEEAYPESRCLRIKFISSVEIQVGDVNASLVWYLTIRSIADRGLENIRYRVVEEESNSISFNCQDFEYEVLG